MVLVGLMNTYIVKMYPETFRSVDYICSNRNYSFPTFPFEFNFNFRHLDSISLNVLLHSGRELSAEPRTVRSAFHSSSFGNPHKLPTFANCDASDGTRICPPSDPADFRCRPKRIR